MTIRKKIILFSVLALGAFLAAVFLVSRWALMRGSARLESEAAQATVHHLQSAFENEQSNLEMTAHDYVQWNLTFDFMQPGAAEHISSITGETVKALHIDVIAVFNDSGELVLYRPLPGSADSNADMQALVSAHQQFLTSARGGPLNGVLDLSGRLVLLTCQPLSPSGVSPTSQATLMMGREVDQTVLNSLSRAAGFNVWMEPTTATAPNGNGSDTIWSGGANFARIESDSTTLNFAAIKDITGKNRALLVGRTPRSLYQEGKTEARYLWGLLMVAGLVYCGILFFFVDEILVTKIARLSSEVAKVTVSGDLSLRLNSDGKDELSSLARTLNSMLAAIQKAKTELLQAQESLRFHAEHDALTGVLNRRAVRDVLRKELARCRRDKQTLGVILADVDHFKKINDHYGHAAGDAVLVTVVQRITSMLRAYDALGRYGGEEFLIIAPGCDLALAQRLAERIRTIISDEPVDLGNDSAPVTVSMGVTLGTAESDPEFLVAQADTAMYNAKRNGRNRVEVGFNLRVDETDDALQPNVR